MLDSRVLRIVVELSTREDESFADTCDYLSSLLGSDPNVLGFSVDHEFPMDVWTHSPDPYEITIIGTSERPGAQRETRGL